MMLDDCEYDNKRDDGDIYDNGNVLDHDYRLKYGILEGTGSGERESPALDGVMGGRVFGGGKCGTNNGSDYCNNIEESDRFTSGCSHDTTIGIRLGQIGDNRLPDICA